jgi:hypothetical protein
MKAILDKFGYAIDETDGVVFTAPEGDFMEGHQFVATPRGGTYFFCNGYSVADVVDWDRHNCAISMDYGMDHCQCGQHD